MKYEFQQQNTALLTVKVLLKVKVIVTVQTLFSKSEQTFSNLLTLYGNHILLPIACVGL